MRPRSPSPHRPPAPRALTSAARRTLTGLIVLALSLVSTARDDGVAPPGVAVERAPDALVSLGQVPAWPLWVESGRGSAVTVLAADGTLWYLDGSPLSQGAVRLARALAGEQATACGPALLVVDERGALRRLPRAPDLPVVSAIGPNVSRFHRAACDPDGGVLALAPNGSLLSLTRELEQRALAPVAALPDAELVVLDLGGGVSAVAVLTEPTQRYRHGALGDEVEAAAVTLLRLPGLEPLGTWAPVPPAVIEARRPTPWRSGDEVGLYVTVSDDRSGARLVRLAWAEDGLHAVASGAPLGASQRWLHLIGATDEAAYAMHDPRTGGPLVRYVLAAGGEPPPLDGALDGRVAALSGTTFDLGLRSHVDGERLLDRAALVGRLAGGADLLLVPSADQHELVWLRCDDATCEGVSSVRLPSPLATNVTLAPSALAPEAAVLADRSGGVWWLPLPLPLAGEATPPSPGER
jgi:hypothetical protein